MNSRKQKIETLKQLLSGRLNPQQFIDQDRTVWIYDKTGNFKCSKTNESLSEKDFKEWQEGPGLEKCIVFLPANNR